MEELKNQTPAQEDPENKTKDDAGEEKKSSSVPEPENPQSAEEKDDAEKNKGMAVLAYILFFVPLLAAKESKFAMYHANQGLLVFLLALGIYVVGMVIPVIGWFIIIPLGNLAVLILIILGIINASKGLKKPLPFIGHIKLL